MLVLERAGMQETLTLRTGDRAVALDAVNRGKRDVKLVEPVAIDHLGVDGTQTRSWLWLPPGEEAGEVKGVIVDVYPGGTDSLVWWDPLTMTYAVRPGVLAAGGYAVLSASIPGDLEPAVRGETYSRAADLAVDAALAANPELPADRLALFGHSFGGYAVMEIATRSTRYQSVIASAGIYDWMGSWSEFNAPTRNLTQYGLRDRQPQGFVEQGQGRFGAPPWAATEAYLASSPWLRAEDVTSPVLLLTADLDFVPMRQAEAMFSALYRQGRHVRLITYWGEKHHVWSPANILDKYRQIFGWLDTTLSEPGDVTQPASSPMSGPRTRTPPPP
jgi:dipeptidyl aminopeptidase/acylaminoacyl peptidase